MKFVDVPDSQRIKREPDNRIVILADGKIMQEDVVIKQIELLQWQKKATQAEYYPSASLVANYGWLGQGEKIPVWNGEDQGVFWSDLAAVGINIQISIFHKYGN